MDNQLLKQFYTYISMTNFLRDCDLPIKTKHNLFMKFVSADDVEGDDGDIDPFLFYIIPYIYGSYTSGIKEIVDEYRQVKRNKENDERAKKLATKLDLLIRNINDNVVENKPQESVTHAPLKIAMSEINNRVQFRQYALFYNFILSKKFEENYTSAEPNLIDVGEFAELSRQQLVDMFNAKNFYNLNKEQQTQLFQAVINDYCKENGVKSAGLAIEDLPHSKKRICYGEFDPANSKIAINKAVVDCIEQASETQNPYLPYKILETLVHESQHRVQFENYDNPSTPKMEKVLEKMKSAESNEYQTQIGYNSSYEELDARDCALDYIKNASLASMDHNLEKFYNSTALDEINRNKYEIPAEDKLEFANVFFARQTKKLYNLEGKKYEFLRIMNSDAPQNALQ